MTWLHGNHITTWQLPVLIAMTATIIKTMMVIICYINDKILAEEYRQIRSLLYQ
uniref:Uncharacterized protein n=1 Tax=Octopus bimaculoides TaxID=37653 RepID=A0A0L8HRZ6_OCTBM